jgi:hypothetical protein
MNNNNILMDIDEHLDSSPDSLVNLTHFNSSVLLDFQENSVPTSVLIDINENAEYERILLDPDRSQSPGSYVNENYEAVFEVPLEQNKNQNYLNQESNNDNENIWTHMMNQTEYSREVHPSSSEAFTEFRWNVLENGHQNFYNQNVSFFFLRFFIFTSYE